MKSLLGWLVLISTGVATAGAVGSLDVQKNENRSVRLLGELDVKIKAVSERGHCSSLFAVDQQPGHSANLTLCRMVFIENLLQRPKSALSAEVRGQFDLAMYLPMLAKPFQHVSASAEPAALVASNQLAKFSTFGYWGLADLHKRVCVRANRPSVPAVVADSLPLAHQSIVSQSTALSAAWGRIQGVQPIKKEVFR